MSGKVGFRVLATSTTLRELVLSALSDLGNMVKHEFASQRTTADQIEHAVRDALLSADARFKPPIGTRASGDILFDDDVRCHINIKSMDVSKDFHMPNLISAANLRKILNRGERFYILRIAHDGGEIKSKDFLDIRDIAWSNLQLAALGAGQIQIKNGLTPLTPNQGSHEDWMAMWRDIMVTFYEKEINKANKRLAEWQHL